MKLQTIINKINKKIRYWEKELKVYTSTGKSRSNVSWMIMELKEIKGDLRKKMQQERSK